MFTQSSFNRNMVDWCEYFLFVLTADNMTRINIYIIIIQSWDRLMTTTSFENNQMLQQQPDWQNNNVAICINKLSMPRRNDYK